MSDTMRTYTPSRSSSTSTRRRRGRGCAAVPLAVLLPMIVLLALYVMWITRDSESVAMHVPKDHALRVVLTDILERRHEIAAAGVWKALPESAAMPDIPAILASDLDVPPWVLNNVLGATCFISGASANDLQDLLFITKMHRLGVVIERGFRRFGDIEYHPAGGLHLRYVPDPGIFYAVRGRVLMVSPSRRTLIRALTLAPDEALSEQSLQELTLNLAHQQAGGSISFRDHEPLGDKIESLRFGIRFDSAESHAKLEITLAKPWEEKLAPLFDNLSPQTLRAPIDGMFVLSANFLKPLEQVWVGLGAALPSPVFSQAQWDGWAALDDGEQPALAYTLTHLLGPAGPGFQITWQGIDPYEILPVPHLVVTAYMPPAIVDEVLQGFPAPPPDLPVYATYPRVDVQNRRVVLPMIGGPSIEPTAAFYGDAMVISNSRTIAESVAEQAHTQEPLPLQGNLYFRIRPLECVDAIVEAGQQFVDVHALNGYTPATYREAVARWKAAVHGIQECSGLLAYETGRIHAEIRLLSRPPED